MNAFAFAQPAGIDDSIMSVKGSWMQRQSTYAISDPAKPTSLFPVLNKKVDSIATVFRAAYPNLKGTDAFWYSSLDEGNLYNGGPWSYAYRSGFLYYYYNKSYKKIMKTGETGTWAYAFVNRLFWLFDETQMSIEVNGQKRAVWIFPHEKGEWNGYTLYEPVTHGQYSSAILITKNGRLPYKPVTQLQYLQALRKSRDKEKQSGNASIDKSIAEIQSTIEKTKNSKQFDQATKDKMIANLQSMLDKQVKDRDAALQKQNLFWDKELKIIDDYLNNTDKATLNQQAIVTNWRIFKGSFPTLKDKGACRLVYVDPEYFNSKLPSYAPQFMVIYWRWNNNAPGLYFKQQFETNLRLAPLKAMIQN